MAARFATASFVGLFKVNGQVPHAVGHALTNMFGQVAGMCRMTRTAGAAFLGLVDVDKMQIQFAISKIRKIRRILIQYQTLRMTTETKLVVADTEWSIKLRRIFFR